MSLRLQDEIRARLRTERALQQEGERLRLMAEQMPAILWTTDNQLRFTSSSGNALEGLKLKPNQSSGTSMSEWFGIDDPDFLPVVSHRRALAGESVTYEMEWAGNVYHSHVEPMRDGSGNIIGVIGVALDITELKRSQENYLNSLSVLQATLDSTADGILVVDNEERIVHYNRRFQEMWKIPPLALQSREDEKALAAVLSQLKDPAAFIAKVRELYSKPDAVSYDELHFKDGKIFERISKPQYVGEKIVGRVWSFRDVSEQRIAAEAIRDRAEKAYRHQSGLLELAKTKSTDLATTLAKVVEVDARTLAVSRVSIWLFSPDRRQIVCEDMYNLAENRHTKGESLMARDFPHYFQALEECRILPAGDALLHPSTREFAESYLKPQGISAMMDVPFRLEGKVIGILCHEHVGGPREWSLEDQEFASSVADMISLAYTAESRNRAEEALQQASEELKRSNVELEQFAYVASHDLQEPLHLISAFTDRILNLYTGVLDEKGADYLRRVQRSVKRMRQLIDDLLQFSRITTRGKPFASVRLNQVLADLLKDLEVRLAETGGKVELGTLPEVFADTLQMRQLFQNLIVNALKFRRPAEAPRVQVSAKILGDGFCEISVQDNGIGFDEKYLEQIFLPFSRLHSYFEYEGSGIGLAVCQKIVSRHGGEITAQSRPGEGSRFIFTLPLPAEVP